MKKIISAMLAICMVMLLLPAVAGNAEASGLGGAEMRGSASSSSGGKASACLQGAWHYDEATGNAEAWSSAILMRVDSTNFVVTALEPREDLLTIYSIETSDSLYGTAPNTELATGVYLYNAKADFGEAEGFCPVGEVYPGETLSLVVWETENSRKVVQATAGEMPEEWVLTVEGGSISADYLIPVLNSRNELCAVYIPDAGCALSLVTDAAAFYGTEDPGEQPPADHTDEQPSAEVGGTRLEYPVDLPALDKIYGNAMNKKQPNKTGYIVIGIIAAAAVVLVAAVVLAKNKKKKDVQLDLDDAEEGTELADVPVQTGLSLQFRSGSFVAVTGRITIGRASDNTVVIPQTSNAVSGRHCEILVQNGAVYLRDLGSTNGTYINAKRLVSGQLVQLLPGMMVGLGAPKGSDMFAVISSGQKNHR